MKSNYDLTDRELQVLYLLTKGFSNEEITAELHIELSTTKAHISSILKKLKVKDRLNAVIIALNEHWFESEN